MTWLITSDIHLSDKPRDEYRFGLFPWLAKQQGKLDVSATFILGDITENKDKHSHRLVNRIVDEFKRLRPPVHILRGNHDTPGDQADPFFRFLSEIKGIYFWSKPEIVSPVQRPIVMIPHCRSQAEFDEACKIIPPNPSAVMLHQTFEGAIAETGVRLSGLAASPATFKGAAGVWSGDVHKPQHSGPITYVGSPYHVKFGDRFTPRVIVAALPHTANYDLHFPSPRKLSLKINDAHTLLNHDILREGDQVKLEIEITREELVEYDSIRKDILAVCRQAKVEVFGVTVKVIQSAKRPDVKTSERTLLDKTEVFDAYCNQEKIPSAQREAGRTILKEG